MRKISLILWAMLVSSVMPIETNATDNSDYGFQSQAPVLDSRDATAAASSPVAITEPMVRDNQPTQTMQPMQATQTMQAVQPRTFVPLNQKSPFRPLDQPRQVAMFRPAFEHDDLQKRLYGWSSTIEVELATPISTKTAKIGDLVQAKLSQDFRWGPQLIASKDSLVRGHVTQTQSGRTLTHSAISSQRRLKSHGILGVQFDEIIDLHGRRWPISATPSPRQKTEGAVANSRRRTIEADQSGRIVKAESELAGGLKTTSDAAKIANMVPLPGTLLFTTLAPAVAMGAVGAASPSIAYDKPIDEDTEHRRVKGAAYGFFSNLPGAFVVQSVVEKGNDVALLPGDPLTLNVCITETGHKLPPGEQLAVSGQVLSRARTRRLYPATH